MSATPTPSRRFPSWRCEKQPGAARGENGLPPRVVTPPARAAFFAGGGPGDGAVAAGVDRVLPVGFNQGPRGGVPGPLGRGGGVPRRRQPAPAPVELDGAADFGVGPVLEALLAELARQ